MNMDLKRNAIVFAIVVIAVSLMLVFGVYMARKSGNIPQLVGDVKGQAAPDFELVDLEGKTVKLSDYRGKAVLLNFWATWCPPCKIEMPWFVDLQQKYGPEGLVVLGVAMDDSGKDSIEKFAKEMNLNYTVLLGKESVAQIYGNVEFLPATFYIDRQGKVVDRVFGLVDRREIEENVKRSLNTTQADRGAVLPAQQNSQLAQDEDPEMARSVGATTGTAPRAARGVHR